MASRMKEDEKNEKIIRGLLKLPASRRCINCNNLGPQYVCTNFWTFICTNCSGAHREFTHRVKSISMANFTSQEVASLQEGGNERARATYFKEWDPQRHTYPDSSNADRLRNFIKHVYVERRYSGENNVERGQRLKGDNEDYNESRRSESNRSGSRSPPYEDRYGERLSSGSRSESRYNYGERSPGYGQGDYKRSPVRFEVPDDRCRDDKSGNGNQNQKVEENIASNALKSDVQSPEHQQEAGKLSSPVVRPIRDILGNNAPQLQVGEPSKSNGIKPPDNSAQTKRISSSSSIGSSDGNNVQLKTFSAGSLIDVSAEPETPAATAQPQSLPQQTISGSDNGGDWASFDVSGQQQMPQVAATANSLESALAELSVPAITTAENISQLPGIGIDSSFNVDGGGRTPATKQQPPSLFPTVASNSQPSMIPNSGSPNNQVWSQSPTSYVQDSATGLLVGPGSHLPQMTTMPLHQVTPSSQQPSVESKPSGRKELPADLFTLYQSAPVPAPGWQRVPYPGMAYGMAYPTAAAMPAFPRPRNSRNPFDFNSEPSSTFPSMSSLQGALPNMTAPTAFQRSQSFGLPSPRWVPPQQFSYLSAVSPSPFVMHQVPNSMLQQLPNRMMLIGQQSMGGPNTDGTTFVTSGVDQQPAARNSLPSTANSFGSVGGNPFG